MGGWLIMTTESIKKLSEICYILSGVFFLISIILFFALNILKVLGYLTGITEKKAIRNIRSQNEDSEYQKNSSLKGKNKSKESPSNDLQIDNFDGIPLGTLKLSTTKLNRETIENMVSESSDSITTILNGKDNSSVEVNTVDHIFSVDYEIFFAESKEYIQ